MPKLTLLDMPLADKPRCSLPDAVQRPLRSRLTHAVRLPSEALAADEAALLEA